jgi:putative tricarboxylic transport membrane protein
VIGRDGISGLVVLAACAVLYALTFRIEGNPLVAIGPAFYPRLALGVTAALAAMLVVADFRARGARAAAPPRPAGKAPNYALVIATFAAFIGYVVLLPYLGFRIATFVFVVVLRVLLDWPTGAKAWTGVIVLGALTTLVTWFAFEQYLAVLLPRGRWTDF